MEKTKNWKSEMVTGKQNCKMGLICSNYCCRNGSRYNKSYLTWNHFIITRRFSCDRNRQLIIVRAYQSRLKKQPIHKYKNTLNRSSRTRIMRIDTWNLYRSSPISVDFPRATSRHPLVISDLIPIMIITWTFWTYKNIVLIKAINNNKNRKFPFVCQ